MRFNVFFISSSLLIALVWAIRKIFRKKLAPGVIYALWLIPLIRLLIPFGIWEFPVMFGTTADILNAPYALVSEWMKEDTKLQTQENTVPEKIKVYDAVTPVTEKQPEGGQNFMYPIQKNDNVSETQIVRSILFAAWLGGTLLLGGYVIIRNQQLKRSIRAMEPVEQIEGIKVCVGDHISVPFLTGLRTPIIIVPGRVYEDERLYQFVLSHELAHFHQKDHIWTAVRIFMCVIYWWHPFVWLAAVCAEEDAELSCDAKVLRGKRKKDRKEYGYALLQMLESGGNREHHFCVATSLCGSRNSIKRRIEEISRGTSTNRYVLFPMILLLITISILGCGIPNPKSWMTYKSDSWYLYVGEDGAIHELDEFEYTIQKDIQSRLIYYEIYEYGELSERRIMSYGDFGENRNETLKLHMETRAGERILTSEVNGVKTEMKIQNPKYTAGSRGGSTLLRENDTREIRPGDDLILREDYQSEHGEATGISLEKELSQMNARELQVTLKNVPLTTFIRIVFSDLPEQMLYDAYAQKEYPLNDLKYAKLLKMNDILYYDTGKTGVMGDSGCIAGYIQSSVENSKTPEKNQESNFGCVGNPFTFDEGEGWIMVFMDDGEYHFFERIMEAEEKQNGKYYAMIDCGGNYPVLLVTDHVYDDHEMQVSILSDVYYTVDEKTEKIAEISSDGTAYPIAYDNTGIYLASGHEVQRYSINDKMSTLDFAESFRETFDTDGNSTYFHKTELEEEEITEDEYIEGFKKYSEAKIVSFQAEDDKEFLTIDEYNEMYSNPGNF